MNRSFSALRHELRQTLRHALGAIGSFTAERLYDTVAGTTTGSFAGTISAPGAKN